MKGFDGKVAVVTGAGSGIGQALAIELGRRRARQAISDVNDDGLAGTVAQLEALGAATHVAHVDVSDRAAQTAAKIIVEGVAAHRPRIIVGNDARLVDLMVRLLPRSYPRLTAWWTRRVFER